MKKFNESFVSGIVFAILLCLYVMVFILLQDIGLSYAISYSIVLWYIDKEYNIVSYLQDKIIDLLIKIIGE